MALGKQVRHYRSGLGWTLERLSEESQVDVGTISAIEQRDSRRSQFGVALARGLGLSLEQLLDESVDHLPALLAGATPNAPSPTKPSNSPSPITQWPFERITPHEWRGLSDADHGLVEAYVRGLIDANRSPRKSRKTGTTG
ncbi:helix-turn-helix domain-containing protein [uncultured Variovorax sp.]|jgi:transcriptional regulator with XRE-family HTH domain|uniref:helix-turn-helix domain-containing protein n=1 Tax=uncultured Variovorax sp. TaxID=114708 RepID=UPI00345D40E4